jgi:RNA polymerase sigma-70 factor (ECF subfamily)
MATRTSTFGETKIPLAQQMEDAPIPKLRKRSKRNDADRAFEAPIIELLKNGRSNEAIPELFNRYNSRVIRVAERVIGNSSMAEEVAQEVFLRVHKVPSKFVPYNGATISTIMCEAAFRDSLMVLRRGRAHHDIPGSDVNLDEQQFREKADLKHSENRLIDHLQFDELRSRVWDIVDLLPDIYKMTLRGRYQEDRSINEMAEISGEKIGTVKTRLLRGVEMLRKTFQGEQKVSDKKNGN